MMRESKPTLTPTKPLNSLENTAFSNFLDVAETNPTFALATIDGYKASSTLTFDAERLLADPDQPPEGRVLSAVAGLVQSEVVFVLEPDQETKPVIEGHKAAGDVSSMAKIKGFLSELVSHQMFLEKASLATIALEATAREQANQDSDLYISTDAGAA